MVRRIKIKRPAVKRRAVRRKRAGGRGRNRSNEAVAAAK